MSMGFHGVYSHPPLALRKSMVSIESSAFHPFGFQIGFQQKLLAHDSVGAIELGRLAGWESLARGHHPTRESGIRTFSAKQEILSTSSHWPDGGVSRTEPAGQ